MKLTKLKLTHLLGMGCLVLASHAAQAITLKFSSIPGVGTAGSSITFNSATDSFEFADNSAAFDFQIDSSTGAGDSVGLLGKIDGIYTIGAITISGPLQTAPVTTVGGSILIEDGLFDLTANVKWVDIYTLGTSGGLNSGGLLNLTSITYLGLNADLIGLAAAGAGNGYAVASFSFIPARSLTDLTNDGTGISSASYSGILNAVPEGGSAIALVGIALMGLEGLRRKLGHRN